MFALTHPCQGMQLSPLESPQPMALQLPDLTGKSVDLTEFHGELVLVVFWTSWCPSCIHEFPSLQTLAEKLDGQGVVLAVNVAETAYRVRRLPQLPSKPIRVLLDKDGALAAEWGVKVFPSALIVDQFGRVIYQLRGAVDWVDPRIERLIQTLIK